MEIIKKHKVDLTGVLSADPGPVVQLAHSQGIITDREYNKVKNITDPEEKVIELLDRVSTKSDQKCQAFLGILREVHDTYPRLKDLFTDAKESDISFSAAAQDTPDGFPYGVMSDAEKIKKADSIVQGHVHHCVQVDGGSNAIAPFIMSPVVSDFNMQVNIKTSSVCSSNKPMPSSPTADEGNAKRKRTADEGNAKRKCGTHFEVRATDGSNVVAPVMMSEKVGRINMPINIDQSQGSSVE
ncbi:hypothetical protein AOXY_G14190 [Acipenser oxyrinchus oxyrinchus]|uniref:CARD domain-containing protein n=1 Tax=Acipenser oxyrinchus oxyrinchus TaxID=40147 RepID=A0AAD8DAK6_ACIOX|nr:hypothetical protein AOXY_G14190 [Acipenser oxyrinchus oxyrinchus]